MARFFNVVLSLAQLLAIPLDANSLAISTDFQAMMYLSNFGYLDPLLTNISSTALIHVSNEAYRRGIAEFQSFVGVDQTGFLDEKTLEWMNKPRCGVPDREFKKSATNSFETRRKRFSVEDGNRWTKQKLTYDIKEYTSKLKNSEVDREIDKAFKFWQNVTSLTFERVTTGQVDIEFRFVRKEHRCHHSKNNDPNFRDLAHAFSPKHGGEVHFQESETWTINSRQGTNLLSVAVHEIGHSLGLFHSHLQSSVMFPTYKDYSPNFKLDKDDIIGIQHLYGINENFKEEYPGSSHDDDFAKEISEIKKQLNETIAIVQDLKTKLNERTRKSIDIGRIPTSCEDLKQMGNTFNGVFLVKGSKKMETIYCDFSQNAKKFETWIGFADVKSAPIYFYATRNYSFTTTGTPIPFHYAIVNAGDAMDLATGKFTAPITGIYFFSFTGMADFPQSSSLLRLGIGFFLNANQVGRSFVDEANSVNRQKSQLTLQSTLYLKKGDQIWVQIIIIGSGVSLYDNEWHYTHFTGFLLDENISL